MVLKIILTIFSSVSFFIYGITYFTSTKMKAEFKRFRMEQFGTMTALLELSGSVGLLVGLKSDPVLLFSSAGLALLMFFGVLVRFRVKDSFGLTLPALFYMLLNLYIFFVSIP